MRVHRMKIKQTVEEDVANEKNDEPKKDGILLESEYFTMESGQQNDEEQFEEEFHVEDHVEVELEDDVDEEEEHLYANGLDSRFGVDGEQILMEDDNHGLQIEQVRSEEESPPVVANIRQFKCPICDLVEENAVKLACHLLQNHV